MSAPASLSLFHLAHGGGWRVLHSLYITSINLFDLLQDLAVAMTGKAIKCSRGRCLYSGVLSTVLESRAAASPERRKTSQHGNSHTAGGVD